MTSVQLHRQATAAVLVEVVPTGTGEIRYHLRSVGPEAIDEPVALRMLRAVLAQIDDEFPDVATACGLSPEPPPSA